MLSDMPRHPPCPPLQRGGDSRRWRDPYWRLFVLILALIAPLTTRADDDRPAAVALPSDEDLIDDTQGLFYLGRDRPVFIQLHIRVDGLSFRANWRHFAEGMFREIDQNADGLLTGSEWERVPTLEMLIVGNTKGAAQGADSVRDEIDRSPADGVVTFDEFTSYMLSRGSRAIAVQSTGSQRAADPRIAAIPAAGSRLFFRLDADRDGSLTPEELVAGTRVLTDVDFDEDGAMSSNELLFSPTGRSAIGNTTSAGVARSSQFIEVPEAGQHEAFSRRLIDHYDRPNEGQGNPISMTGDDRLSRDELPIEAELFQALDRDGDGTISFEEIPQIVSHSRPSLVITVRIGDRQEHEPPIEVARIDPHLPAEVQVIGPGRATVLIGGDHLSFAVETDGQKGRLRESLLQVFKTADRDNNSYLEMSETQRTVFALSFRSMDEDGDGKLFQEEFLAWLGRREGAAASRCQMSVANEGRNLFDNLDLNHDGRITPRELRNAPERARTWDVNADSKISPDEIPAHFQIVFGRAQPEIPGRDTSAIIGPASLPASTTGPGWFQRMDRNHDGEISRREFLGPRPLFDRYDKNGDGVIEPGEATGE